MYPISMKLVNITPTIKTIIFLLLGVFTLNSHAESPALNDQQQMNTQLESEMELLKQWAAPPKTPVNNQEKTEGEKTIQGDLDNEDMALLDEIQPSITQEIEDSISLGQAGLLKKSIQAPSEEENTSEELNIVNKFSTRRIRSR